MPSPSMTPRERVLCALALGEPDAVPFAEPTVNGGIACQLLGVPVGSPLRPSAVAEAAGIDVVKFSRLPPFFHEKVDLDGKTGYGPGLIRTREDLPKVVLPEDEDWIEEARRFLKTEVGDRASVGATRLGLSGALVSMGLEGFSMALHDDPGLVEEVLERYAAFAERTVLVFQELGFDLIWCFDDFAYGAGPMFSPRVLRETVLPRLRRAADQISIPWIFHSDGNLFPVIEDLLTLGMNGLHPIQPEAMDLGAAKRALQGRCCVVGNVSVDLLARGTPEQVRAAVEKCFEDAADGGGYMLTTGNSITNYAALENVRALVQAARELRFGP